MPQAHLLLTLSFLCGAGVFWAVGNRLYSRDNNYRNLFGDLIIPEDWKTDPYYGAWLVGEWVGVLIAGICVVRASHCIPNPLATALTSTIDCVLHCHSILHQPWKSL